MTDFTFELISHCHLLMYNHFAATLGNLDFLGTGECEKMRCANNTQQVVEMCGEVVFEKAKAQVEQLSSKLVLTASGRHIWQLDDQRIFRRWTDSARFYL